MPRGSECNFTILPAPVQPDNDSLKIGAVLVRNLPGHNHMERIIATRWRRERHLPSVHALSCLAFHVDASFHVFQGNEDGCRRSI